MLLQTMKNITDDSRLFMICRYLSYVMDVASPTKYCIDLIYDFLCPVIMKKNYKATLSHQEVVFFLIHFLV